MKLRFEGNVVHLTLDLQPVIDMRQHQGLDALTEFFVIVRDKVDEHLELHQKSGEHEAEYDSIEIPLERTSHDHCQLCGDETGGLWRVKLGEWELKHGCCGACRRKLIKALSDMCAVIQYGLPKRCYLCNSNLDSPSNKIDSTLRNLLRCRCDEPGGRDRCPIESHRH